LGFGVWDFQQVIKLSVNINKVATVRNSRGGHQPSVLDAARVCVEAGAPGITVHPRADQRHITAQDVTELAAFLAAVNRDLGPPKGGLHVRDVESGFSRTEGDVESGFSRTERVEFNIEGDPRPDLLAMVHAVRPTQCTLVPVRPGEITSQAGWPADTPRDFMGGLVGELRSAGIRVSLFVDPEEAPIRWASEIGADRIELYTEPFARAFERGGSAADESLAVYTRAAEQALPQGAAPRGGFHRARPDQPRAVRGVGPQRARLPFGALGAVTTRQVLLLGCVALLLGLLPARAGQSGLRSTRTIAIRLPDGRSVDALHSDAAQRPAAAVVLVPMLGRGKEDWQPLIDRLVEANLTTLAIDLPGVAAPADSKELASWHTAVVGAVDYLFTRSDVRGSAIGAVGASLGANLAAVAAAADDRIRSLALVSPSTDYRGVRIEGAMKEYADRPALLLASLRDPYAARSVRELAAGAPGGPERGAPTGLRETIWSEVPAHGTVLLARQPELIRSVVDWFQRTLQ
jgi:pyridoxine 5-phosphate synthase